MGPAKAIVGCGCCCMILVAIIMICSAFSVLGYNEVGLNYSAWFKTVEKDTYTHGITYIGLGHEFIKYDIKVNTIEFSSFPEADLPMIKCRTADGLELDIEASLQYVVQPNNVYNIYTNYGKEEKEILSRVIIDVISDTATGYKASGFFEKRSQIQKQMKADLEAQISARTWHDVVFFQLRSLSLPQAFESAIELTEVTTQDIHKAEEEKARDGVQFATDVELARLRMNSTFETAYGEGNKTVNERRGYQLKVKENMVKQAKAITEMKQTLGVDNAQVIEYLKYNMLRDYQKGRVAMQLDI